MTTISAISQSRKNGQKNDNNVKPVSTVKNGNKSAGTVSSYQLLLEQALSVYQR